MTYNRVFPRDLFNDANLLKCLAQLTMLIEDGKLPDVTYTYDGADFNIVQDISDGSTYCTNLTFYYKGEQLDIWRPMNSRRAWPLYCGEELVFDEAGRLILDFSLVG